MLQGQRCLHRGGGSLNGGAAAVQRILELSGLVKVLDIVTDPSERLS